MARMTTRQLSKLHADLLRLYEDYQPYMTPAEQKAVTDIREFIYERLED